MNKYFTAAVAIAFVSVSAGAYLKGRSDGQALAVADHAKTLADLVVKKEEAMRIVAEGIAQIKVENKTIVQKFKETVKNEVIYRDCKHPDAQRLLLNGYLTGRSEPSGDSKLPK